MLEADLSKTTTRLGVRIAQTPEEKITAGLQEAQSHFFGAASGLAPIGIGAISLASFPPINTGQVGPNLVLFGMAFCLLVCFFAFHLNFTSQRTLDLASDRAKPWYALSRILTISAVVSGMMIVVVSFGLPTFGGQAWAITTKSYSSFFAIGIILMGAFIVLASSAAGLEALAWIGNIRRDLGVTTPSTGQRPLKPADPSPTDSGLAQTS
jgi:hypothetical protein